MGLVPDAIGAVMGLAMVGLLVKIAYEMGCIKKGLNGLVKIVDDHEGRLRDMEDHDD